METRICHWCEQPVAKEEYCPRCSETFKQRPEPHTMTPEQRQEEFEALGWCEVPFDWIHERIEALVGRPVWTHELGLNSQGLWQECRWESRPATMEEIIELIPEEKRIVFSIED